MKKNRVVPVWVSVVLLILCVVSIVESVMMLTDPREVSGIVVTVLCIIDTLAAVVYCVKGYGKNAARYFMAFSVILTLIVLLQVSHFTGGSGSNGNTAAGEVTMENPSAEVSAGTAEEGQQQDSTLFGSMTIVVPVLIFAMLFTLTVAKDLGRKKSYCLIGTATGLALVNFIMSSAKPVPFKETRTPQSAEFAIFVLCAVYGVMIYAKYRDKAARGTK